MHTAPSLHSLQLCIAAPQKCTLHHPRPFNQGWPCTTAMHDSRIAVVQLSITAQPLRSAANSTVDSQASQMLAPTKPPAHKQSCYMELYCCLHRCTGNCPLQIWLAATTITLHRVPVVNPERGAHELAVWSRSTLHTLSNCCCGLLSATRSSTTTCS